LSRAGVARGQSQHAPAPAIIVCGEGGTWACALQRQAVLTRQAMPQEGANKGDGGIALHHELPKRGAWA